VSAMSLLTITSHHHLHRSHNTLSLHKSEIISRQVPAPAQHHLPYFNHGTRVSIRDLFGSMPVRVRQRAITAEKQGGYGKDWEVLKRSVVMLLLAWPRKVAVTVREVGTDQKMAIRSLPNVSSGQLDVSNVCNILSQASFITRAEMSSWVSVGASTAKLKINGTICLEPSATKSVQFISFGIRPLAMDGQGIIHDEINRLFSNSTFGNEEATGLDTPEKARRAQDSRYKGDGYTSKELKAKRKAIDRWPMFYINVQQTSASEDLDINGILDDKGNSLRAVNELLEAMILGFLAQHDFQPKGTGGTKPKDPQSPSDTIDQPPSQHTSLESHVPRTHFPGTEKIEKISSKDTLGANIKLPSFRRTETRPDSPFEAWSQVKSGTVPSKTGTGGQVSDLERPSTAPPLSTIQYRPVPPRTSTTDLVQTAPGSQAMPLVSSTGRIVRPPFEDISVLEVPSRPCVHKPIYNEDKMSDGDDLVSWMNPVTKVTSLVNKRTGLVRSKSASVSLENDSRLSSRTRLKCQAALTSEPSPWLASVLESWDNPVFRLAEAAIPQVSLESSDEYMNMRSILEGHHCHGSYHDVDRPFKELPAVTGGRISKDALRNAEVISQVDKKFILVKLHPSGDNETGNGTMLVIIDQHAADERIRIEGLMEELCMPPPPDLSAEVGVQSTPLENPLSYALSAKEIHLFGTHRPHFTDWGIVYDLPAQSARTEGEGHDTQRLIVRGLPPGIVERCKASPRLLLNLLRTEIWRIHDQGAGPRAKTTSSAGEKHSWVTKIHSCPQGIIDMLNSRACRSAIMFNDELSNDQCTTLISRLAECAFPFQCAHGRPSLVPLVDLGTLGNLSGANGDSSF
jgi:DNA mismatch repair protein MLH3